MRLILLILALVLGLAAPAAAQPLRTEHTEMELVSARAAIAPGERFTIALRQRIIPGWHTYWINAGDSGEPTELTWALPPGFTAGPLRHPAPEAHRVAIVMSYIHRGEVLYPIEMTAPANLSPGGSVTLRADAFWLVCSDICLTEQGPLALTLPVAAAGADDAIWAPRIAAAVANLPRAGALEARISAGPPARLSLTGDALAGRAGSVRSLLFFPFARDVVRHIAPQPGAIGPNGASLTLEPGPARALGAGPLAGVITFEEETTQGWAARAFEINAIAGAPLAGADGAPIPAAGDDEAAPAPPPLTLPLALVFAFLGGLILNIMPCVLPVLSIKALSLAGGAQRGEARRHGLLYTAGVLAAFAAFAGVLIGVQGAGAAIGWGFQLQAPWVIGALALLFFAIGLNLLGVFEIGGSLQNAGAGLAARGGDLGAFLIGALAVIAATPCTAPFMAGATGLALTQAPWALMAIFLTLGLGFATPFLLLSFSPGLQRLMPKPGPWMERVKQALAFPMFATAVWLAWVLTGQMGARGVLLLLGGATALGFSIWALRAFRGIGARGAALAFAVLALAGLWLGTRPSALASEAWSVARVAELRVTNRPILVNFTADWCVTCKVNEGLVFTRARVADAFTAHNAAYLVGDWTNRDDAIAAELARHGRAGVPLYLYYAPGATAPVILPQILSETLIIRILEEERP